MKKGHSKRARAHERANRRRHPDARERAASDRAELFSPAAPFNRNRRIARNVFWIFVALFVVWAVLHYGRRTGSPDPIRDLRGDLRPLERR